MVRGSRFSIEKLFFMPDTLPPATKDPALHKLPTQSIEAEESILSAILISNDTLIDILEILSAGDFYKTAHQIIFTAIETLYAKNEPVDLLMANTYGKYIARDDDIPYLRFGFPIARTLGRRSPRPSSPVSGTSRSLPLARSSIRSS